MLDVNDELIYSHYYTSLSKAVSIEGSCIINLIQLNTLNSGEYVNTAEVTYSFDGDRNLDSADDEEATLYHKELNTTNNLTYLIDGYANDKVPNYWSKYSWTKSLEYGYYSDGVNHDRVNSLQPYVPAGEYVDFVIYNRDLHGCMFYEEVDNLVYPLDWFVTDNNTYSGLNINLIPSATSIGHINTLTLTANLGVKGKTIKLYNNNSLISSGDTGVDGKKTLQGIITALETEISAADTKAGKHSVVTDGVEGNATAGTTNYAVVTSSESNGQTTYTVKTTEALDTVASNASSALSTANAALPKGSSSYANAGALESGLKGNASTDTASSTTIEGAKKYADNAATTAADAVISWNVIGAS